MKSTAWFAASSAALCVLASTAEAGLLVEHDMAGIAAGWSLIR